MGRSLGRSIPPLSIGDLLKWLGQAPAGTMLDAGVLREVLERATPRGARAPEAPPSPIKPTWRERLWTAPAETRIGVKELAEAMGRPRSWVYRRTGSNGARALLPHRKLDGELVFVIEDIRRWVREHEADVTGPPGAVGVDDKRPYRWLASQSTRKKVI
jgi:hypothetical protein